MFSFILWCESQGRDSQKLRISGTSGSDGERVLQTEAESWRWDWMWSRAAVWQQESLQYTLSLKWIRKHSANVDVIVRTHFLSVMCLYFKSFIIGMLIPKTTNTAALDFWFLIGSIKRDYAELWNASRKTWLCDLTNKTTTHWHMTWHYTVPQITDGLMETEKIKWYWKKKSISDFVPNNP